MPWYQAPAKVNLGLWVGPRDASGYHPIDTVMQTVAISDQLYLEPRDHMLWESSWDTLPMDERNLVVRAYLWCRQRIPNLPLVYGRLVKVIPAGAGLGGGSSDAAAVIRWALSAAPEWKTPEFVREAAEIGMDVPFFICGGAAQAQGYGEQLTHLRSLRAMGVVLANPGVSVSTPEVYQAFDEVGGSGDRSFVERVALALQQGQRPEPGDLVNDLEKPAWLVLPALRDFKEQLVGIVEGAPCTLSGSGPTYCILGRDEDWAEWMARRLRARGIPWAQPTTTLDSW